MGSVYPPLELPQRVELPLSICQKLWRREGGFHPFLADRALWESCFLFMKLNFILIVQKNSFLDLSSLVPDPTFPWLRL